MTRSIEGQAVTADVVEILGPGPLKFEPAVVTVDGATIDDADTAALLVRWLGVSDLADNLATDSACSGDGTAYSWSRAADRLRGRCVSALGEAARCS